MRQRVSMALNPTRRSVVRPLLMALAIGLAVGPMAADRDRPDAPSLRALAMDPLDAYEEYEALWETAATPTVQERSGWRALIETLDGGVAGDVRGKCGYRVWTARDEDSWREETFAPWRSSPWELHTVDGEPPDKKVLNAYEKDRRKAAKREAKERRRAVRKGEDGDASAGFHPLAVLGMLPVSEPDVVMVAPEGARFFGFRADRPPSPVGGALRQR